MAKTPFKLKSGNSIPFKKMGSSPAKQAIGGGPGEALEHYKEYKKKTTKTGPKSVRKAAMKAGGKITKALGSRALGVAGMMMATSSKADQPKKGKGKREYPGGKIDFTSEK